MKSSLCILLCFAAGIAAGRYELFTPTLGQNALTWSLCAMLFLAGMGIGFDVRNFLIVRTLGVRIIFLPLCITLGTFAGSILTYGILTLVQMPLSLRDTVAVGAGFGYYSLSSVMIAHLANATLGSIALIANITREIFTLVCTPLLVRFLGGLAPVATGGAASMDTCMPVIARYAGEQYAIMGIFSGMILTMAVPLFVAGIFQFFP